MRDTVLLGHQINSQMFCSLSGIGFVPGERPKVLIRLLIKVVCNWLDSLLFVPKDSLTVYSCRSRLGLMMFPRASSEGCFCSYLTFDDTAWELFVVGSFMRFRW